MIPSVSESFISNNASLVVVPIIGSPPIPIAVVIPNPVLHLVCSQVRVPDLETTPTLPVLKTNPGIIPHFAPSGVIIPGS